MQTASILHFKKGHKLHFGNSEISFLTSVESLCEDIRKSFAEKILVWPLLVFYRNRTMIQNLPGC